MAKAALKIEAQPIDMQPGVVAALPLDLIDFDPGQPRKDIDQAYIEELAADICANGVLQPITVRPNPKALGRWYVVYGECRTRGSRVAGQQTIPALLAKDADDLTRLLNQVKENHIRRSLNPIELALVLRRMRDEFKVKSNKRIEETLKTHGITNLSDSYISNLIRLVELPDWAQQAIREGELTASHGKYLLQACASEPVMTILMEEIVEDGEEYSVRDLQNRIGSLFISHHINLTNATQTPFDYKEECVQAGCQHMRKVSGNEVWEGFTFCLGDPECHKAKRRAAAEAKRQAHMETVGADANTGTDEDAAGQGADTTDARQDAVEGDGAEPTEFSPPRNHLGLIRNWLVTDLNTTLYGDTEALMAIALMAAVNYNAMADFGAEEADACIVAGNITDFRDLLTEQLPTDACRRALPHMLKGLSSGQLIDLANYTDITIDQIISDLPGEDEDELRHAWDRMVVRSDLEHEEALQRTERLRAEWQELLEGAKA